MTRTPITPRMAIDFKKALNELGKQVTRQTYNDTTQGFEIEVDGEVTFKSMEQAARGIMTWRAMAPNSARLWKEADHD